MAKLSVSDFASLANQNSFLTALNANFALVEAALENTLSRDGTSPNEMEADLDMNSNRILNLLAAVADTEPVRLLEFQALEDDVEAAQADATSALSAAQAAQSDATSALNQISVLSFLSLTDTPGSYAGAADKIVKVNAGATALEFASIASVTVGTFDDLTDVVITSISDNEIIQYDSGTGTWINQTFAEADILTVTAAAAAYQPLDADLTTWAGLTPSANAQSLVTAANYAAMRALLDLEAGTDFYSIAAADAAFQPLDADLTSWAAITRAAGFDTFVATPSSANLAALLTDDAFSMADAELGAIAGLVSAADRLPYFTGAGTAALATFTAFGRSIVDDADEATFKATVNLEIGVDVQAYDADLTTWAGLTPSANAQSLVTAADYAAMRTLLDLEAGTDFYSIAGADAAFQPLDADLTSIAALTTTAAGRSVLTVSDDALDEIVAWDDSAGTMKTFALADFTTEASPAAGDYLIMYGAEGDVRKVDWSSLPGAGGGIDNVVEDLTPQLGGFLDWNGQTQSDALLTDTLVLDLQEGGILRLTNDAAGATGVVIQAHHDSASPALDDIPFALQVLAGADDEEIGQFRYRLIDGATTTEDGAFEFYVDVAGASALQASVGNGVIIGTGTTFPGAGNLRVTSIELGADTDTTLSRSAAGVVAVEGNQLLMAGKHSIWIPAHAMVSRTTNGAASGSSEAATNKNMFKTLDFDTTTQEFAQFFIRMPKSWNESTVTFAPVWSHAATVTNFGVVFGLAGVAISNDDAGDVAFGTAQTSTDTGGTTDDIYEGPESSAITIAGTPAEGDYVMFQLNRTVADGSDTLAVDARLHGIVLFYTVNAATDA